MPLWIVTITDHHWEARFVQSSKSSGETVALLDLACGVTYTISFIAVGNWKHLRSRNLMAPACSLSKEKTRMS